MKSYAFTEDHRTEIAGRLDIMTKLGIPLAGVMQVSAILTLLEGLVPITKPAEKKAERKATKAAAAKARTAA